MSRCLGAKFNTPGLAWTFPDHRHPTLGSMRIWPTIPPKLHARKRRSEMKQDTVRYNPLQFDRCALQVNLLQQRASAPPLLSQSHTRGIASKPSAIETLLADTMELMASEKPEIKYFKHIEIRQLVNTLPWTHPPCWEQSLVNAFLLHLSFLCDRLLE